MLVNVHLSNQYAKQTTLLYLYYRMRMYAQTRGGSIEGFKLTKNEEYNILPKLKRLGWVFGSRLINYRKVCNMNKCLAQWVDMKESYLVSIDTFKGFLVSLCEASLLRSSYRRSNGLVKTANYRDKGYEYNRFRLEEPSWFTAKKIGNNLYQGRVSNQIIAGRMGISETTVTNWRKSSLNRYDYRKIKSKIAEHNSVPEKNFYYSRLGNTFVTIDCTITTGITIFTIRGIYSYK
jgi:hypothetical protein